MNITVICLGKLKEKYLTDAINEYSKRISAYGKLDIIELTPVKLSENPSDSEIKTALEKDANAIATALEELYVQLVAEVNNLGAAIADFDNGLMSDLMGEE